MGKLSKIARIGATIVSNPRSLRRVLEEDDGRKKTAKSRYGIENGLPRVDLLTLFPDFTETVEPYSFLWGTSSVLDLALLKAFAREHPECSYLEIGSWRGESMANVASVSARCVSISLSENEMKDAGLPEEFIAVHGFFSRKLENVQHIGHDSRTFDFTSLGETFDLIFIDGDHHYEGIRSDTENAFRLLKDERSVIVWHDYGNESVRWTTLAAILDGCPADKRGRLYDVSNTHCAAYIPAEVETATDKPRGWPDKRFEVSISARRV